MAESVSRQRQRRSLGHLPLLAAGLLLCVRTALPSTFASTPSTQQRRAAVAGLVAAPIIAQQTSALAEEEKKAEKEVPASLSKTTKAGTYSFELPQPAADWTKTTGGNDASLYYKRKDGAFVFVTPVKPGFVKTKANKVGFPGQGAMFSKYKLGPDMDEFEYTKLSTAFRGAMGGGPFPGGFFVNDGDPTTFHEWNRCLHGAKGDVMITVAVGMDKYEADKAKLEKMVNSFKLA